LSFLVRMKRRRLRLMKLKGREMGKVVKGRVVLPRTIALSVTQFQVLPTSKNLSLTKK